MIAVVDYGMGNLRSVQKAFEHVGGDAEIISHAGDLQRATKIVLPGVGAFADAIDRLRTTGLAEAVIQAVHNDVPFLGICLGFQLVFDVSYEDGEHTGLGLIPGKVVKFNFPPNLSGQNLKIPHMGWNQLSINPNCPLFSDIEPNANAYFVHSYHAVTLSNEVVAATTEYGYNFPAAVWKGNLFATQFHPEKSQAVGLKMLENFVRL